MPLKRLDTNKSFDSKKLLMKLNILRLWIWIIFKIWTRFKRRKKSSYHLMGSNLKCPNSPGLKKLHCI